MEKEKLITFLDNIGRTIFGLYVKETDEHLVIKNAAVLHAIPNPQTGQISLQILPLLFKEFLADKSEDTIWNFPKSNITRVNDVVFDFKLDSQYRQIFSPITLPPQSSPTIVQTGQNPAATNAPVIELFDK